MFRGARLGAPESPPREAASKAICPLVGSTRPIAGRDRSTFGVARNEVGDWTRESPTSARPIRTYEGNTSSGFAWSVGIGDSYQITEPGRWPVIVEAAWR